MSSAFNKAVVIVAGGVGSRMQSDVPKQFIHIKDKPIIIYTIEKFLLAYEDTEIVISCHKSYINWLQTSISQYVNKANVKVVEGGATRFHSAYLGLQAISFQEGLVAIHDAARPFVKPQLIKQLFKQCAEKGNALPAIPVKDTIRQIQNNSSKVINRNNLRKIQTPQCFHLKEIKQAFDFAIQQNQYQFTDDAAVLEFYGKPVFLSEGQVDNIKITTPFDLKLAELLV